MDDLALRETILQSLKREEVMANKLCGQSIFEIEGIVDIEYPSELNAFIAVTDSGKKYLVEVSEYREDK